jgi:hypothetical protein
MRQAFHPTRGGGPAFSKISKRAKWKGGTSGEVHSSFIFIFFGGSLISIQLPLTMVAPDRDKDPLSIFASGPGPCPHSCARPFFILSRRAIHRSIERRDATRRQLFFIFPKSRRKKLKKVKVQSHLPEFWNLVG